MAFWNWSRTAATNATADPTIVWSEGQAPSSVNDSARAMMARTAEWRDDISGTITTTNTSTAYNLASNQIFTSLANMGGAMIAFVPHVTNGQGSPSVTLNVDGLGAKPLRSAPAVEIGAGTLIQGTPYTATYNAADAAFYLQNFYGNPYNIPIGGVMPYLGASAPNTSFAIPSGQAISRTTYATLFALVSTTFGVGDGTTTFNIPDLRGRAIFGQDNTLGPGSVIAGRITNAVSGIVGTTLGASGSTEGKIIAQGNLPSVTLSTTISEGSGHKHGLTIGNAPATGAITGAVAAATSGVIGNDVNAILLGATGLTASTALGGSGIALPILPPAMILPFILRVI